mmetsp:Transcript_21530/g.59759  ORF Transcript_21530/g.59759 Transcript_21530/m.59759 type:complete len:97 (-) Transcript_21530:815-1105(-)
MDYFLNNKGVAACAVRCWAATGRLLLLVLPLSLCRNVNDDDDDGRKYDARKAVPNELDDRTDEERPPTRCCCCCCFVVIICRELVVDVAVVNRGRW